MQEMTLFYECNENRVKKLQSNTLYTNSAVYQKREKKKLGTVDVRSQCDEILFEAALLFPIKIRYS